MVRTFDRNSVRASCCVSVLPPSAARAAAQVADERPGQANRIDAGMVVEAAILDGDDRVLQVGRDRVERDVVALLIEPEPRLAVAAVEHRVADAARQPMDGDRMARHPPGQHSRSAERDAKDRQSRRSLPASRPAKRPDLCHVNHDDAKTGRVFVPKSNRTRL